MATQKTKKPAKPAAKKPAAKKPAAKKNAPKKKKVLEQITPFRPDPTKYTKFQLVQDAKEVGFVFVKGSSHVNCVEYWQLYKPAAAGVGMGENGFQRYWYMYPSYEANVTESPDVTTRYIYVGISSTVTAPPGLVAGTHYQNITASCRP
jgi:hypothetical protein